jgi:hypothetical protein
VKRGYDKKETYGNLQNLLNRTCSEEFCFSRRQQSKKRIKNNKTSSRVINPDNFRKTPPKKGRRRPQRIQKNKS